MTAELFAPGIVSTDALESLPAVPPDMDGLYFIKQSSGTRPGYQMLSIREGEPHLEPVDTTDGLGEVFISPDGTTMHLGGEYRTRTDEGWSDLKTLGPMFNDFEIMRLTASDRETYVFDVREETGTLRFSRLVDGERQAPQPFGDHINTGRWTAHPFIAPDESYLIWDSERPDGYGDTDLYISFRQDDGSYGPAINMGPEVNTDTGEMFGAVTPDGQAFMFSRIHIDRDDPPSSFADIYWIDAAHIDTLRP